MDSFTNMHVFGDRVTIRGFTGDSNSTRFDGVILEELRRLGLKLKGMDINAANIKSEIVSGRLKVSQKNDIRISGADQSCPQLLEPPKKRQPRRRPRTT
jgi:hypothetical protein